MSDPTTPATPTAYDRVPYHSLPFAQTHPARLAAIATLLGLAPPPVTTARVLEIGCAAGGNIIPMALELPTGRFTGFDLSRIQIEQGRALVRDLGLVNIGLTVADVADPAQFPGEFDYIVCHGVYSWISDATQTALLQLLKRHLAPSGIAYVSYNTLPGWNMRGMVRDLMRFHAEGFPAPAEQVAQARAILAFMAQAVPADAEAYRILLRSELEALQKQPDHYILHEHLEENNRPVYFRDFAQRTRSHGLQYLGEADFGSMLASRFGADVARTIRTVAPDLIRQEQIMDFLRNRMFRQTLLVHDGVSIDRTVDARRIMPLHIASPLQATQPVDLAPDSTAAFAGPADGAIRTAEPVTKAALLALADAWPGTVAFDALVDRARARCGRRQEGDPRVLATDLLQGLVAGLIEVRTIPYGFTTTAGHRPLASPLARWQAERSTQVTNLRHESINIDTGMQRLLPLLDGTRTRQDLCAVLDGWAASAGLPQPPDTHRRLDQALGALGRAALLVA
jgi:methyltransferase-like protein/SAM-dependent methyltransferase